MTKKIKRLLLSTLILISFFSQNICSDGTITVGMSEFTITITKVEISYDSGSTWNTIYESATGTTMNINSADIGARVSSLTLATNLPNGTVNRVRVTAADTASFTGHALYEGVYFYHDQQSVSYTTLLTQNCSTSILAPSGNKVTVTEIPANIRTATFSTSVSVSEGQITTVKLNISLVNSLVTDYLLNGCLYASPLSTIGSIGT